MRLRATSVALLVAALVPLTAVGAEAAAGPPRLQRLAQEQTDLLYRFLQAGAPVSPAACGEGQRLHGVHGTFLLPVRSFSPGDTSQRCVTSAPKVLLDVGGATATEDDVSTWQFADGTVVPFVRANLERICDDVLARGFVPTLTATVDGRPVTGVGVSTPAFVAHVNPAAGQPYADSVTLGHPGELATSFCGYKAELHLKRGRHTIVVDYTPLFGSSSVTRFTIDVR